MKLIRVRVVILICWLAVFYSLERLLESINESRFTYTIALIMVLVALLIPHVTKLRIWLLLAIAIPPMVIYKVLSGSLATRFSIPIVFMEICFISLATLLALWINSAIEEFENSIEKITMGSHVNSSEAEAEGQALLYREVRRARNHQRPLTLMKVEIDENSIEIVLDRMVQEAQQIMKKQYALSNVSKTLCDKLEDSDIIVQKKDYFLIILPETKPENIPGLIDRLQKQVSEKVGVNLKIGTASLPRDGLTLEGLLNKASLDLQAGLSKEQLIDVEQLFVKRNSFKIK